uniref:Uncharacterized protein n=1 Tax=Graphocephala atropunctata TaxID=36148 RepID=A0A1B6L9Z5_9HEMI
MNYTGNKSKKHQEKSKKYTQRNSTNDISAELNSLGILVSKPSIVKYHDKELYVYTVQSTSKRKVMEDLEFVIYIPINSGVRQVKSTRFSTGTSDRGDNRSSLSEQPN